MGLRRISIVFVAASVFQALGRTLPALATSFVRLLLVAGPAIALSRLTGFELRWIWWIASLSSIVQMTLNLWLLRRELHRRLPAAVPGTSAAILAERT